AFRSTGTLHPPWEAGVNHQHNSFYAIPISVSNMQGAVLFNAFRQQSCFLYDKNRRTLLPGGRKSLSFQISW
ncbi:MAG: hypothetical protein J6N53_11530, partial [Lachnospiraceae bacterium]|nr:hypothetical protein [Lachnospiraceae bacterium]